MEGLRYFRSWTPAVGQRWHCKSTKATFSGVIKAISGGEVLLEVADVGERWLSIDVLKKNFFPLTIGHTVVT